MMKLQLHLIAATRVKIYFYQPGVMKEEHPLLAASTNRTTIVADHPLKEADQEAYPLAASTNHTTMIADHPRKEADQAPVHHRAGAAKAQVMAAINITAMVGIVILNNRACL